MLSHESLDSKCCLMLIYICTFFLVGALSPNSPADRTCVHDHFNPDELLNLQLKSQFFQVISNFQLAWMLIKLGVCPLGRRSPVSWTKAEMSPRLSTFPFQLFCQNVPQHPVHARYTDPWHCMSECWSSFPQYASIFWLTTLVIWMMFKSSTTVFYSVPLSTMIFSSISDIISLQWWEFCKCSANMRHIY